MKKYRFLIFSILFILMISLSAAYCKLSDSININGTAQIVGNFDVLITNVEVEALEEDASSESYEYTDNTITIDAILKKPGDFVTYSVTITNKGNIDAKLDNVSFEQEDNAIKFLYSDPADILKAGESTTFNVSVYYDIDTVEDPSIKSNKLTASIIYVQE